MGIQTLTGIPKSFTAGDTVLFTENFTDFPNDTWTAKLWLNLGSGAPTSTTATVSGSNYLFTLANTYTANLSPAQYEYNIVVTNAGASQTAVAKKGLISVLPNYAVAQTPTFAEAQVALLQTVLAEFNATTRASVSFNGQSFSRASISEYQKQLLYWEARVLQERAKTNALRGTPDNHLVGTRFIPAQGGSYPWTWAPYWPSGGTTGQ